MSFLVFDRDDFFKESDCLIALIKNNPNSNYHEVFTNLIIIDLVINLETFIERLLENYISSLKKMQIRLSLLHTNIQKEHLRNIFSEAVDLSKHDHKRDKFDQSIASITSCIKDQDLNDIRIDLSLGMGKHGEKEIENLFKKIGFEKIYTIFKIPIQSNSMLESDSFLDINQFIQTLTEKRNIAIHQGVSFHSTFTIDKLEFFSKNLELFFSMLNDLLNFSLQFYQNRSIFTEGYQIVSAA